MTAPRPDDDAALLDVLRLQPGTAAARAAAAELLGRYRDAVYLWCYRYTRDRERALDLSQDVLTSAWQRMDGFEGRSRFSSWLFAIARNRCIDASRRVDVLVDDEGVDHLPATMPAPDAELEQDLGEARLLELIRTALDAQEQEAIWLRCIERMPVGLVSERLGVSGASGARAVLQRARRKLRAALDQEHR